MLEIVRGIAGHADSFHDLTGPKIPFRRKTPADLRARREMRVETRSRQPDESREGGQAHDLDGPQTPAVPLDVTLDAVREAIALLDREEGRKVLHDACIAIQPRERFTVAVTPCPEPKAFCVKFHRK